MTKSLNFIRTPPRQNVLMNRGIYADFLTECIIGLASIALTHRVLMLYGNKKEVMKIRYANKLSNLLD